MLINDVLKCSFSYWYTLFSDLTIESDIIKLDSNVKEWILADGIILPRACFIEMDGDSLTEDDINEDAPEFTQLEALIRQSIHKYDYVFPKLNWSACEDAKWIQACGTKCNALSEIFLLLKSSDKIVHDLTEVFKRCSDYTTDEAAPDVEYELVLRKWININPSMEFRIFIGARAVLGISQRDVRSFYAHLGRDKESIVTDVLEFYGQNIRERFPVECFVLDVYRPSAGHLVLIDINPFGETTDSLLFDWEELRSKVHAPQPPVFRDFRYIEEQMGVQPNRLDQNALPVDVFNGGLDPRDFQANLSNGGV